jgi:hypothetical protein
MKKVFTSAFMYAPKQTGGNVKGMTISTPEGTTAQNEAASNENKPEVKKDEPPEPTSEKLTAIRANIDDLLIKVTIETDRKKKLEFVGELQKEQANEQTEINAIKKALLEAQIAEKKNAKIAFVDQLLSAFFEEKMFFANDYRKAGEGLAPDQPNPLMEQMNTLTEATKNARENVVNLLVGTVSAKVNDGEHATGTKGDTAKQIISSYEKHLAALGDDTEARKAVIAEGFSRGTTGAVVLAYRKEKGLA